MRGVGVPLIDNGIRAGSELAHDHSEGMPWMQKETQRDEGVRLLNVSQRAQLICGNDFLSEGSRVL